MSIVVEDGDVKPRQYTPSKWESRIDDVVRKFAPQLQMRRTMARQREYMFRYLSALPTTARPNSSPYTSGENLRGSREKMQVMWNALDLVENSGLCGSILTKICNYICGTIKYQARTGNRQMNKLIQDYVHSKSGKNLDLSSRNTLRQMGLGFVKSIFLKGDVGVNMPNVDGDIYLQGIEGDRIGDPYDYLINNDFVRGVHIEQPTGRYSGFDVYTRDRMSGRYVYDATLPARDRFGLPCFLFSANRVSLDEVRGITIFNSAINNASYINQMRQYELMAMLWASSRSGVFHTESGMLPPDNGGAPFGQAQTVTPQNGWQPFQAVNITPNQLTALGISETVQLFPNDRPSPNVIAMYNNTIQDIACGCKLSMLFVWAMTGMVTPAVRYVSKQDSRQMEMWQADVYEDIFEPIIKAIILNGVAKKELLYHPRIFDGMCIFPPHPSIDALNESDKDIQEINAGINSGTRVAAENNGEIEEITDELGHETAYRILAAQREAEALQDQVPGVTWREVLGQMRQVTGETRQAPIIEASMAAQQAGAALKNEALAKDDPAKVGATDDGKEME